MNNYTDNINIGDILFTNPFVKVVIKTHDNRPLDIPINYWNTMLIHKSAIDSGEPPYICISVSTLINTFESCSWMPEIDGSNGYYIIKYLSLLSYRGFISREDISQEYVTTLYYEPHIDKVYYDEAMSREVSIISIRHLWILRRDVSHVGKMIYSHVYESILDKIILSPFHISRNGYFPQYVMMIDNVNTTFYGKLIRIVDLKIEEYNCQNHTKIKRDGCTFINNEVLYYIDDDWMASMLMIPLQKF